MDYSQLVSQAAAYTEKFINAAIPVAKQAYEIGLLTLQIDAISVLVPAMALFIASTILFRWWWRKVRPNVTNVADTRSFATFLCITAYIFSNIWSVLTLFNLWIWVKLFKPELWLAKQAIAAVLNATGVK